MTGRSIRVVIVTGAMVLLGASVRVMPLFHDFWLDEAWSYLVVRDQVTEPADILTRVYSDNNHPINSLAIFLLQGGSNWIVFRLPALVAGVLCVPLSGLVMRRFGKPHACYSMALVACSYPLIVYSTEARGYSMMVLFVLLAVESQARWLATRDWMSCVSFSIAVILGFLSHLTFIHAYVALLVFSAYELRRGSSRISEWLPSFAVCHAVPLLFLAALYLEFIRHIIVAGAAPTRLMDTLIEAITMTLGGPGSGPIVAVYVFGFLSLLVLGLTELRKQQEGWHLLFLCGIVLVPLPLIIVRLFLHPESTPVFPRYFLTSITLFLLLAGYLLGDLHGRGSRAMIMSAALSALIIIGNFTHIVSFTRIGRGQYLQALQHMVEAGGEDAIHVAGNSDFRTPLLISFYAPYLPDRRQIIYHSRQRTVRTPAVDWWILEFLDRQPQVSQKLTTASGSYSLERHFDFYGPSGCGWAIYRRSQQLE